VLRYIRRRRRAFTILELLIVAGLIGLMGYAAWDAFFSGTKTTDTSSDFLSAMQGATILMEMIQEDVRQMAVLNERGCSLVPYTVLFSKHGKSIMFRKSSLTNTSGEMEGSSFTVVVYQLVEHATEPGCYTVRRVERTTDGRNLIGIGDVEDERTIKSLLVKDIRFDLMVKFEEAVGVRTFIRVSITATNLGAQRTEPRVYLMSNVFEATSPPFIHTKQGQVGFARRFLLSSIVPTNPVLPGKAFHEELPPSAWPEFFGKTEFDYVDKAGVMRDFPPTPGADAARNPFERNTFAAAPLRQQYIKSGVAYFENQLGPSFNGRILVSVNSRPTTNPKWSYGYSLDASNSAKDLITKQLNDALTKIIEERGEEGVEQMGHAIGVVLPPDPPPAPQDTVMISPAQAQRIAAGS
jgi:hypothetical protein